MTTDERRQELMSLGKETLVDMVLAMAPVRDDGRKGWLIQPAFDVATEQAILLIICQRYDITREILVSRVRTERIAHIRQLAMVLVRRHCKWTLCETGRLFERDHGTVLHAECAVRDRMETSKRYVNEVAEIEAALKGWLDDQKAKQEQAA